MRTYACVSYTHYFTAYPSCLCFIYPSISTYDVRALTNYWMLADIPIVVTLRRRTVRWYFHLQTVILDFSIIKREKEIKSIENKNVGCTINLLRSKIYFEEALCSGIENNLDDRRWIVVEAHGKKCCNSGRTFEKARDYESNFLNPEFLISSVALAIALANNLMAHHRSPCFRQHSRR